jgi:hypothetical protein
MGLDRIYKNLLGVDTVEIMVETLEELDKFMSDLNREQLIQGKLSTGDDITPDYTETTVFLKEKFGTGLGKITDNVTLYDTGNFHKSIFAEVFPDEVIIDATDGKLDDLESKYSKDILGLTNENIKKLKDKALPIFYKKLDEQIFR